MEGIGKICVFLNGKLVISEKQREIGPRLLLIINRKWHSLFRLDGNHGPWITLKVTDNQYGWLS